MRENVVPTINNHRADYAVGYLFLSFCQGWDEGSFPLLSNTGDGDHVVERWVIAQDISKQHIAC